MMTKQFTLTALRCCRQWINRLVAGLLLVTVTAIAQDNVSNLPADSLYQSESQWQNMKGQSFSLSTLHGRTQIIAFVYTHCVSMCPVIVADLKRIEAQLSQSELDRLQFTLISLDPIRDLPEVMTTFMNNQQLNVARWQFLRGSDDDTRELAMLCNVRYRQEENEIAHSNTISVLDKDGRLVHQRQGSGGLDAVLTAIRQSLR